MKILKFIGIVFSVYILLFGDCIFIYIINKPNPIHRFTVVQKYTIKTCDNHTYCANLQDENGKIHEEVRVSKQWYDKYQEKQIYYGKFNDLEVRKEDDFLFTLSVVSLSVTILLLFIVFISFIEE